MKFDEIVQSLKVILGANIAQQKDIFSRKKEDLQNDDAALEFVEIYNKSNYTLDDINDMLICYSDHYLTVEEILDLAIKNNVLLYDKEQYGVFFPVKNAVLLFLLSQKDTNIVYQTLKCFSYDRLGFSRHQSLEQVTGLTIGDTLYDLYLLIENIKKIEDVQEKKRKIIGLMGLISPRYFTPEFKKLIASFDDIDEFFQYISDSNVYLDTKTARNILDAKLVFDHKPALGDEQLYNKVREEYKKYAKEHLNFTVEEFINYYNTTFKDNFNAFYFNVKEPVLLTEELFYLINNSFGYNYFIKFSLGLAEYSSKFSIFNTEKYSALSYVERSRKEYYANYDFRELVLTTYANVLERLKRPLDYTLSYFVYLNVAIKHVEEFLRIVDWYCDNKPEFFGFDVRKKNEIQKRNTFEAILAESKADVFKSFKYRRKIHSGNYDKVVQYVANNYISKTNWNSYIASFEIDYYVEKGLASVKILLESLKNGENVYTKALELGIVDEINYYFDAISTKMPELANQIAVLRDVYKEEKGKAAILAEAKNRKSYAEECSLVIARFLAKGYKSKEAFLEDEGITVTSFDKILLIVEEFNPALYLEFMNKYSSLKSQRYAILMKTVDYVLNALVNGVEENGVVRPFNFMDYSLLTKMPFDEFAALVVNSKKLNNTNIRQFRQFEKAVRGYKMVSNEYIFNEKIIVKLGDTMHEVTAVEKELALRFLRFKGLRNYYVLYKFALKKVLSGEVTKDMLDALENEKATGKKLA